VRQWANAPWILLGVTRRETVMISDVAAEATPPLSRN
jgi:hypothetical protein